MENTGNREKDIMTNTKKFVSIFEKLIVQNPDQWMMFHPFWPPEEGGL
jgi:lauroyl/myristoyl acyltransferase